MAIRLLVLALLLTLPGCARPLHPEPNNRPPITSLIGHNDKLLLEVEQQIPGFGGVFIDLDNKVNVFLSPDVSESNNTDNVKSVLIDIFGDDLFTLVCHPNTPVTNLNQRDIAVVPADHSISDLVAFRKNAFELVRDLNVLSSIDLNEATNRIEFGVGSEENAKVLRRILDSNDIPSTAVSVTVEPPLTAFETLELQAVPPAGGGGRIVTTANLGCAFGFAAYRPSIFPHLSATGVVAASHCSLDRYNRDTTEYSTVSNFIGPVHFATEYYDPPVMPCQLSNDGCRYSDASFAIFTDAVNATSSWLELIGNIAQVESVDDGNITLVTDKPKVFEITETASHQVSGQLVDKVGPQTGWTTGRVIHTDKSIEFDGVWLIDQVSVAGMSDQPIAARGDSGAPVFFRCGFPRGPNVRLLGKLVGGNSAENTYVFSPFRNIELDLGELEVLKGTQPD